MAGRPNLAYVSDTRSLNTADVQFTRQCGGTSLTGAALTGALDVRRRRRAGIA